MSLKAKLSHFLERFEAGRAFKQRLKKAMREQGATAHHPEPSIAHIRYVAVEASFLCNLKCKMCPRLAEGHKEGLMPMERFARLFPLFPHLDFVVLTGYGEPLVHPQLHEFVSAITRFGIPARLSTNGMLLDEKHARQLIEAGVENLQFSIDAGTKESYEQIRVGAKWERVLENAARFHKLCAQEKAQVGTGWVFVVMRDNWRELPQAVQEAANAGFPLFIAKFIERNALDYEHEQLIHNDRGEVTVDKTAYDECFARAQEIATRHNMEFRVHPFFFGMNEACLADPRHAVFVDWMGNVTPCCHLPVRNTPGQRPDHCFGNIDEQDFISILAGPQARQFHQAWSEKRIPAACRRCYQLVRLPERESFSSEALKECFQSPCR